MRIIVTIDCGDYYKVQLEKENETTNPNHFRIVHENQLQKTISEMLHGKWIGAR